MTLSGRASRPLARRPEIVVAVYTVFVQALVLAPLRGPFNYADELGYVAAARYFGPGYPEVQLQAGFLHAGYGIVLSPLTAVFTEPSGFHRAATVLNGVLLIGAAVLACRLLQRLYELGWWATVTVGVLFASSTASVVFTGVLWAETLLIAMIVGLAWLVGAPSLTTQRVAALAILAVSFYAVHPRAIVVVVSVAIALIVDGRRHRRTARTLVALVAIVVGVVSVRAMHGLVADRLYAGSAFELGTNTSVELRLQRVAERPANWLGGLIGAAWYQLAASFGLAAVASVAWLADSRRWLARPRSGADDQRTLQSDALSSERLGFVMAVTMVLGWALAGTIAVGTVVRIDQVAYGRYLDHIGPMALATGAAVVLSPRRLAAHRHWLAGVVGIPVIGVVITLWWGVSKFDGTGPYAPINAPFFATVVDLVDSQLPVVVGLAIGGIGFVAWAVGRNRPALSLAVMIPVLVVLGVRASVDHVRVHSRDTVNLRAMADAVEDSGLDDVMLAEPFAFINLYGGQYWADDVQFLLGSECPVRSYGAVIAPIDDPRYLDHRVLFTDPRSERQLLEPPAIPPPDPTEAAVVVDGVPATVAPGEIHRISLSVTNTGAGTLPVMADGIRPVFVGYRFIGSDESPYNTHPVAVPTGPFTLAPGEQQTFDVEIAVRRGDAPLASGRYDLVADLFVEGLGWVHEAGCPEGLPRGSSVDVIEPTSD